MLKIVAAAAMQEIDQQAASLLGVPGLTLMERAGQRLARHVRGFLEQRGMATRKPRVVILAGSGKNGGDGLVCGRWLSQAGVEVRVLLLANAALAPETKTHLAALEKAGVAVDAGPEPKAVWPEILRQADLAVDALLGIGRRGPLRPAAAAAIRMLNDAHLAVVAADIPSGLDANNGQPADPTVRADLTVTFGLPKLGLFNSSAVPYVGGLGVETLGFPSSLLEAAAGDLAYVDALGVAGWLPQRPAAAHKKTAGRVLVIGGSRQYHGALLLAGLGAQRAGAGYVTLAYPEPLNTIVRSHCLEELCAPLPATEAGDLSPQALEPLLRLGAEHDAVILGPGLGLQEPSLRLARTLVNKLRGPGALVVDADGLASLHPEPRDESQPTLVITPHAGEAGRLLRQEAAEVAGDPLIAARALAEKFQAVALLKGRHTVVAAPSRGPAISSSGTPALAVAGTGDVLAGAVAALCSQKLDPWPAACLAAYLHGRAGALASREPGGLGVRSREVASALPLALRELRLTDRKPEF